MSKLTNKEDARITKTRQKVLDKGAEILFTDGWSEVTHLRLAEETGVARGTIYRHWPTIDDLLVEIFVNCDPSPYSAPRSGDQRTDLIAEAELLSQNLNSSKLGDIILNAARLAPLNPKMALIHEALHEIILVPFMEIINDERPQIRQLVSQMVVAPILYEHLFTTTQPQFDADEMIDRFLIELNKT